MLNATRTGIVIVLTFYLVALAFFLNAMGNDMRIDYTSTEQKLGIPVSFLGMEFQTEGGLLGNIILSISTLPVWFNTLFIVIPATLLTIFAILMFIPTIDGG